MFLMHVRFLGKDPDSQEGQSPTLFATDRTDRKTYIGEEIRYVTRDQARDLPDYDYWLFDSRLLIKMHFDEEENFLGGEVIKDPVVIVQHGYWRDAAWHRAVRRDDFATEQDEQRPQRS
jgi:hypothetical protein